MLCIKDVTFQYLGAAHPSLLHASLTAYRSGICVITGDNGSGKTTLALTACGVVPHLIKGAFSGTVRWGDDVLSNHNIAAISTVLFQNPYTYFQGVTIEDELALCSVGDKTSDDVVGRLLPDVPIDTPLHCLSLGQQARVALFSALRQPTPILVLDEPFESLDDCGVALAGEALVIEARRNRLILVVHRWAVPFPSHEKHRTFLVAGGTVQESSISGVATYPTIRNVPSNAVVLDARGLSFSYEGRTGFSMQDVSLSVHAGEMVAVVGSNGCGKSTLLLLLAGLLKSRSGEISLTGRRVSLRDLRSHVRCALQNPESQIFGTTVREELEFGLRVSGLDDAMTRQRIEAGREFLPFDLDCDPFSLSYGQKKLLSLVCAFVAEPRVLLLDEPIAGLDSHSIGKLCQMAQGFLAGGGAILMTSHNSAEVDAFCTRALRMEAGRLIGEEKGGAGAH
jgi:energy-coupling factor transport system ATP-binding protein